MMHYPFSDKAVELRRMLTELSTLIDEISAIDRAIMEQGSRTEKAEATRAMLRARDLASSISGELSTIYWEFRGHNDPRQGVSDGPGS